MRKLNANLAELRNHVKHWQLPGATYFLTWRIVEGSKPLTPAERDIVAGAVSYFDSNRYQLYAYVVMDDHVHVILRPLKDHQLSKIIQSLKSYTTKQLWESAERRGAVWQKDYFDRIIRSESDLLEKMQYVLNNPAKRWPGNNDYKWVEAFPLDNIETK
jgi:REP element-mobilizing transposase RayT